ncbi:MAG: DNA repair protein RadA, partial [Phascolarctobacterium sp.]|nr:DNA repair protein RadA [Phascolarctobacterium sp.]
MAKTKYHFVCQSCGFTTSKWLGRCPECGAWDSFSEEAEVSAKSKSFLPTTAEKIKPKTISSVAQTKVERLATGIREFDRVLGGGVVPGSLVLLGGTPGIGKSTILLDAGLRFGQQGIKTLYVSGEESEEQTAMRAARLGGATDNLLIMTATDLDAILVQAQNVAPKLLIIDSIQTMYNPELQTAAGSVGQVRECTAMLLKFAKEKNVPVILIGHITKDGAIAGPKILEHIVDVVIQFEGDQHHIYRVLRSIKNRFGSTAELGIYEMRREGLRLVENPSELLLGERHNGMSGVAIASAIEGVSPFLIEAQALVSTAAYGTPQRSATGFDIRRMNMLLAVLEKRVGFKLAQKDVYLNIAGGLRVNDPAIDLSVISAILSSNMDVEIEPTI